MKRPRRLSSSSRWRCCCSPLARRRSAARRRRRKSSRRPKNWREKYVPITELREETDPPCDTSQEQYQPTSVDTVLGNPDVVLQHGAEGGGPLVDVRHAPTAAQIAGLGDGWYLNLEGRVLGNTCVYAKAFKKLIEEGKAPAVTYAHIAREKGHSGFALQYWFFWYFNQFNDLHEGDWEGMQITFEADTPAVALHEEPSEIILFQHAGGERAKWTDGKVQKEGTHPIVYPAAGSHATFYDSAVYVENGQHGSGLGCDNTTGPLRELTLTPVLMPGGVTSNGPFAWTSYYGRWGEREKGFNNGPTGPQTKTQWREPFSLDGKAADHQPAPPRRHDRRAAGDEGVLRRRRRRLGTHQPRRRIAGRRGGDGDRPRGPARSSSSASPGGARWKSTTCAGAAPSARSCAPRASSTAATGGCSYPWRWRRWC